MRDFGRIIATVFSHDPSQAAAQASASITSGADRVEIRIDAFGSPLEAGPLLELAGKIPLLFSGNRSSLTEHEAGLLKAASTQGAWIDIPYENGVDIPDWADRTRTVISCHREMGSCDEAAGLLSRLKPEAAVVKLVPPVRSLSEAARFIRWIKKLKDICPLVAFPCGGEGSAARIISLARGSESIYAASEGSPITAEGQMKLNELLKYRPKDISEKTAFYGLLGYPLEFSLSPGIWNEWFRELGIDARFLLFPAADAAAAIEAFSSMGIRGFGVTAPYKEKIIDRLGSLSNIARKCGAVNTVLVRGGKLHGTNTDVFGVKRSTIFLKKGSRVLVLGSGGAARAAVFALRGSHSLTLSARSVKKGMAAAEALGASFVEWEKREEGFYDLMINATSCGGDGITMPWREDRPLRSPALFEMVTSAGETPLEKKAAEEGLRIIRGRTMLYHQAALQFRILTGTRPPGNVSFE